MEKCHKIGALYVATLKGIALIHLHNHWTTKGNNFYGDHLLFERIYNSALANLDLAAEKFIGVFGEECLDWELQTQFLTKVLERSNNFEGSPVAKSMSAEKDFLKLSSDARDCFESEGKLTLGLDDMLAEIASKREEAIYLLKQTL